MHKSWMRDALNLAKRGRYSVHPNPLVGCVIVKNHKIIGQGFHEKPGLAHAEINALQEAGTKAHGASVYINLEPCCHFGRTPPCVDALIHAGVKEVLIAIEDPNPQVAGQGIAKLKAHGIKVSVGLDEAEARQLNRMFFHYITTQRPYVIGKWAMSLDGKMVVNPGDDPTLSSPESLKDLHELRQCMPAILIGANTALQDNPSLTVRLNSTVIRHPQRIVLNTKANLPNTLKLFDGSLPGKTWLVCGEQAQANFPKATTEVIPCKISDGHIDLPALLKMLGEREISGLLVEGGPHLLQSFFQQNLIHEVVSYVTPWIIGTLAHKIHVQGLNDVKLTGTLKE